jgi:hypothetical protein
VPGSVQGHRTRLLSRKLIYSTAAMTAARLTGIEVVQAGGTGTT